MNAIEEQIKQIKKEKIQMYILPENQKKQDMNYLIKLQKCWMD